MKTTKPGGSGIGVYQSKLNVEAHGGLIGVQSRAGIGSTITVFPPLASATSSPQSFHPTSRLKYFHDLSLSGSKNL